MQQIKAIIFDLDGTLLDTVADIASAMNTVLLDHGLPLHAVSSYKQFVGHGLEHLLKVSLPAAYSSPATVSKHLPQLLAEYHRQLDGQTKPYPHIEQLLTECSRRNIQLAILSNKAQEFMPAVVNKHFSQYEFALVLGAQTGIPPKPDPSGAKQIMAHLKLPAEQIIYVGDSDVDMQTAQRAGLFAIGAAWGFRGREELYAHGADIVIDDPVELITILDAARDC